MTAPRPSKEEIERVIHAEISRLVEQRQGRHVTPSEADRLEDDLGLTSLELTELGLRIEHIFDVNPFEQSSRLTETRTVGDVCAACRPQPIDAARSASRGDFLLASRSRAEARRRRRMA